MLEELFDEMAAIELSVQDSWMQTIGERFTYCQKCANKHNRYAVTLYGDDALGQLLMQGILHVTFFLEHAVAQPDWRLL